jgi:hypothetical protein
MFQGDTIRWFSMREADGTREDALEVRYRCVKCSTRLPDLGTYCSQLVSDRRGISWVVTE